MLITSVAGCASVEPLQAETESETVVSFALDRGVSKSAGFHVCTRGGSVDLVSVEPLRVEGEARFLGAYLLVGAETPIGTANGFPPENFTHFLIPLEEASVSLDCDRQDRMNFAQVVVGVDWSGDGGGAIEGFRVLYDHNGVRRSLEVPNFHVAMCGADNEYCDSEPLDSVA